MEYTVKFTWDDEACVWIAQSDDVRGLVLESGSFDALVERVRIAVPELLASNNADHTPARLRFISERYTQAAI